MRAGAFVVAAAWCVLCPGAALAQSSSPVASLISANRYGAAGDGKTLDTAAIQAAIDAAAKTGGTVVFSAGTYLSGAIFLKSGVHFRVDQGVEMSAAFRTCPPIPCGERAWPGSRWNGPLP